MSKLPGFLHIPRWSKRASGLIVPSSVADLGVDPQAAIQPPAELIPRPTPIAVTGKTPTDLDQMCAYVDESALKLNVSTVASLREDLAAVPFEPAMEFVAQITAKVFACRRDLDAQIELAKWLYGDDELLRRIRRFMAKTENPVIFAEQNCMVLERLLIESAAAATMDVGRSDAAHRTIIASLIGAASVSGQVESKARAAAVTPQDFLALFIQNGAYNSRRAPIVEITRAMELFERLAARPDLQVRDVDIDAWAVEDTGFTISEQLTLGFVLSAITRCWDGDPRTTFKIHTLPENFDDLLLKLGFLDRRREALELISATREEFLAEFEASGTDSAHLAWETRPILTRPFLRLADDGLVLLSPRAMQSWLTEGVHYRLLTSAQNRSGGEGKISRAYTQFAGRLLEAYTLEEMRSVLPGERPAGGGRVHGELPYGPHGEKRTSDVAVDFGQDLVLIEVSNRRLRADTVIVGNNARVAEDIEKGIVVKLEQLDGCVEALIAGEAVIPDVDMTHVRRIWPVLVTASDITQTSELWSFVASKAVHDDGRRYLSQTKVQPVTLLDTEDYDQLLGMVERGYALHELLAAKTKPEYRHLELAIWVNHDPKAPSIERPPKMVDEAFKRTMRRLVESIDFDKGKPPEVTESPRSVDEVLADADAESSQA